MSDENVHADDDDNSFEQIEELEDKVLAITEIDERIQEQLLQSNTELTLPEKNESTTDNTAAETATEQPDSENNKDEGELLPLPTDMPSATAMFEDWLLQQAAETIETNFPKFKSIIPLIEARRKAVRELQNVVTDRVSSATKAEQRADQTRTTTSSPVDTTSSTTSTAQSSVSDAVPVVEPDTGVLPLAHLAVDIRNRRAMAALLRASVASLANDVAALDAKQSSSKRKHAQQHSVDTNSECNGNSVVSAETPDLRELVQRAVADPGSVARLLTARDQRALLVASAADALPRLLSSIPEVSVPALAEENARLEQSIVSRLFRHRVDFLQETRFPVTTTWFGMTVDMAHEDVTRVFETTNWLAALSGVLTGVLSGEPHAGVLALVLKFASTYGVALSYIDRGHGIRFCIPWLALNPPNPFMILPTPRPAPLSIESAPTSTNK